MAWQYHGKEEELGNQINVENLGRLIKEGRMTEHELSAQNRFALGFRGHNGKTEAVRRKNIQTFVEMLERGETIYPQGNQ